MIEDHLGLSFFAQHYNENFFCAKASVNIGVDVIKGLDTLAFVP